MKEIDPENGTFRISEEIFSAPLQASIRAIGQLNPVLLLGGEHPYRVVCGFRRLHALRNLGAADVLARVVEKSGQDSSDAFNLALWDNLSHRQLDPLEKARVLFKLVNDFGVSSDEVIKDYLPSLDLPSREQVLRNHIMLHASNPGLRSHCKAGHLTMSSMEYLAAIPDSSQEAIASVMEGIRLSAGLQKKFLSLLKDLAAKSGTGPEFPFKDPDALSILGDAGLSPYERGEKVVAFLYRLRYPEVTQAGERFLERKRSLDLPGSIRITPAPYFETPDLCVEFTASDPERFRELAAGLFEASRKTELDGLFEVT